LLSPASLSSGPRRFDTDRNAEPQRQAARQRSFRDTFGASRAASPGARLAQFSVDLPEGYGLALGASPSRPVRVDTGAELSLSWSNGFYTPDQRGTLATLDSSTPSYADCVASTKFTRSVIFPKPGTTFCYLGHDLVVGIKIVQSRFGEYDTIDIVVWQAPQSPSG
jgi:hypothetical protein